MESLFDHTVFALSQSGRQVIEIIERGVSNGLFDAINPLFFLFFALKVVNGSFVGEIQHEQVHVFAVLIRRVRLVLQVDAGHRFHPLVLCVALSLVTVKLFAEQDEPVLLKTATPFLLLINITLYVDGSFALTLIAGRLAHNTGVSADTVLRLLCLYLLQSSIRISVWHLEDFFPLSKDTTPHPHGCGAHIVSRNPGLFLDMIRLE
jgi:hypothetical protein